MHKLSKRERVERTLNFLPVDRVAILEQVCFSPSVISLYTGKYIKGFDYKIEDVCRVIKETLDMCFMPSPIHGTERIVDKDGGIRQNDNWTFWVIQSPSFDANALKEKFLREIDKLRNIPFDAKKERDNYHKKITNIQNMIGDDTVIFDYVFDTGLCSCWNWGKIEPFTFLYYDEPEIVSEYLKARTDDAIRKAHAIADKSLSPLILIADDLASKTAPIFSPEFLRKEFFPHLKRIVTACHEHGVKTFFHSDGNWKILIPDFLKCSIDGFYCLEPSAGMDIIELKKQYPDVVWAGGLDGVDLMERGKPEDVRREVRRQIEKTDALRSGGIFLATSSEINPPVKAENFKAMIDEGRSIWNER